MSSLQSEAGAFDFTPVPFDFPRLVEILQDWARDAAAIDVNASAQLIWIFPRSAGSAIHLAVSDDECEVFAGLSYHDRLLSSNAGDENRVLDCVQAIAEGHAYEYYTFAGPQNEGRSAGAVGASYQGRLSGANRRGHRELRTPAGLTLGHPANVLLARSTSSTSCWSAASVLVRRVERRALLWGVSAGEGRAWVVDRRPA